MRLVFLGSPPFATPVLGRLIGSRHQPDLVVTPPPRPAGRGKRMPSSPVGELAKEAGLPLLQPESVRDEAFLERLREAHADVFLVVSYGELLRQSFLDIPREVALNVHPSLLPRHRGATPVPAAILAGDRVTGVSIQRIVLELDAGDVLAASEVAIDPEETAGELAGRLAEVSGELVLEALDRVADGSAVYTPQDPERVTVCRRLTKADGWVDWSLDAATLARHVRAMNPWPLAHTTRADGAPLRLHRARPASDVSPSADPTPGTVLADPERLLVACGEGALELTLVQAAGKRAMDVGGFLRGARLEAGERLGQAGEPR